MIVCVPLTTDGQIGPAWGKAGRVAVARVEADGIADWEEFEVGWDRLHDEGTEGGHHARIARFLVEHKVGMAVSGHMGPPMQQMLGRMGITVRLGAQGDARRAVEQARQALA
jgi:predicted Fe-Mo cluster-binding NifX family protein